MADLKTAWQVSMWVARRNHRANSLIATLPAWAADTSYTTGEIVQSYGSAYQCVHSGTSGSIAPGGTSGLISDGGVDWLFIMPKTLVFLLASAGQNLR